jgi:hypothetical protein
MSQEQFINKEKAPEQACGGTGAAQDEVVAADAGEGDAERTVAGPAKPRTKLKKPVYLEGVDFAPAFLATAEADELLALMKSQPFADNRVSYGPQVFPSPRKSNAWKDRYAWATNPHPEPALVQSLRLRLSERYGVPFNSVQCNWHEGTSAVRPHADPYRVVAMVRLGATRTFEVGEQRRNGGGNFRPYLMPHGSLMTFLSGGLAHKMLAEPAAGNCVSLVFRLVTPPQTVASWHDKPTNSKTRAAHKKVYDAAVNEYREAGAKAPQPTTEKITVIETEEVPTQAQYEAALAELQKMKDGGMLHIFAGYMHKALSYELAHGIRPTTWEKI